jgi:hypothetical protein
LIVTKSVFKRNQAPPLHERSILSSIKDDTNKEKEQNAMKKTKIGTPLEFSENENIPFKNGYN